MTSADVRQIFDLGANTAAPKKAAATTKKPDGVSRELYALIGDAAPTLVAQVSKPRFKQRPDLGRGRVKWEWKSFKNSARKDGLQLWHWAKASEEPSKSGEAQNASYKLIWVVGDYAFAKYNIDPGVLAYSEEDYASYLNGDLEWSKEDTDYLFGLVKAFGQRFVVVADRYDPPSGTPRSIVELKARYYGVCRTLIDHRMMDDDPNKPQALASYSFDKEQENIRIAHVTKLLERPPEQIKEEEALYIEVKRLEQTERRFTKEREDMLRMLAGIESGLSGLNVADDGGDDGRRKRRKSEARDPDSPFATGGYGMSKRAREHAKQQAVEDQLHCITRMDSLGPGQSSKSSSYIAAYNRASRIPVPKTAVAPRISNILGELGISSSQLVMPTRMNIEKLESLMTLATALVEMKKAVDRVDQEIRVVKNRMGEVVDDVEMAEHPPEATSSMRKRSISVSDLDIANKRQRKE